MADLTDYDSPWKEALELYFPEFLALCFPAVYAGIDWTLGYEFLDKELQQIVRDAALGRRLVDKLVKVWLVDGRESWLLVHVEVQGQVDAEFAQRMYTYHYRIFDRYARQVVSLAVLGDEAAHWRPTQFGYERWGCRLTFEFPSVKLLDYRQQWAILEESDNPFAVVIMAHLKTQETAGAPEQRAAAKWALTRRLYERGYTRQAVLNLFRFIDWLLALPAELEQALWRDIQHYEEAQKMTYVTSVERIGIEKGIQQGIVQGIQQGIEQGIEQGVQQGQLLSSREALLELLETRFDTIPIGLARRIHDLTDVIVLKHLHRQAILIPSLADFTRLLDKTLAELAPPEGGEP